MILEIFDISNNQNNNIKNKKLRIKVSFKCDTFKGKLILNLTLSRKLNSNPSKQQITFKYSTVLHKYKASSMLKNHKDQCGCCMPTLF